MITTYNILACASILELVFEVNNSIIDGWQPQGGCISLFTPNQQQTWAQAMVKIAKEPQ